MTSSSNGTFFGVSHPLCGEFTAHRWIPLTKASDAELWYFLWSALEQTTALTIETPVICDVIALIMTSIWCVDFIYTDTRTMWTSNKSQWLDCDETIHGQCCHERLEGDTSNLSIPWWQGSYEEPTWDPSGADRTQVGPMLAPWTLLSGLILIILITWSSLPC